VFGGFSFLLFLCDMENGQQIYDLMKNKDYADAFHNYFFLLGCNKKRDANVWKKKMDKIEKEYQTNIAGGIDPELPF
jgi:hypothetical protein